LLPLAPSGAVQGATASSSPPLPFSLALSLCRDLLLGAAALWRAGLVHGCIAARADGGGRGALLLASAGSGPLSLLLGGFFDTLSGHLECVARPAGASGRRTLGSLAQPAALGGAGSGGAVPTDRLAAFVADMRARCPPSPAASTAAASVPPLLCVPEAWAALAAPASSPGAAVAPIGSVDLSKADTFLCALALSELALGIPPGAPALPGPSAFDVLRLVLDAAPHAAGSRPASAAGPGAAADAARAGATHGFPRPFLELLAWMLSPDPASRITPLAALARVEALRSGIPAHVPLGLAPPLMLHLPCAFAATRPVCDALALLGPASSGSLTRSVIELAEALQRLAAGFPDANGSAPGPAAASASAPAFRPMLLLWVTSPLLPRVQPSGVPLATPVPLPADALATVADVACLAAECIGILGSPSLTGRRSEGTRITRTLSAPAGALALGAADAAAAAGDSDDSGEGAPAALTLWFEGTPLDPSAQALAAFAEAGVPHSALNSPREVFLSLYGGGASTCPRFVLGSSVTPRSQAASESADADTAGSGDAPTSPSSALIRRRGGKTRPSNSLSSWQPYPVPLGVALLSLRAASAGALEGAIGNLLPSSGTPVSLLAAYLGYSHRQKYFPTPSSAWVPLLWGPSSGALSPALTSAAVARGGLTPFVASPGGAAGAGSANDEAPSRGAYSGGGAATPAPPPSQALATTPSTSTGRYTFSFSDTHMGPGLTLSECNTVVSTRNRWATACLAWPATGNLAGITSSFPSPGKYMFTIQVLAMESGAGCVIGFVDVASFDPSTMSLGAQPGSWAYSKTGKIANGNSAESPARPGEGAATPGSTAMTVRWEEFGESWAAGDTITAELDKKEGRIRYFRNGICQGTAFADPELKTAVLRPAICIGSNSGDRLVKARLLVTRPYEFDRSKAHHRIVFTPDCTSIINQGKWATVLAAHPGITPPEPMPEGSTHGTVTWTVKLDETSHGAGVAVGLVDATRFDCEKQNLGASAASWCFSKTGKKGDGGAFLNYGRSFTNGDVIGATLDLDAGTLSFSVNGEDQGVAYNAKDNGLFNPGVSLVPAVCLGSSDGNKTARVSLVSMIQGVRRFDRTNTSSKVKLTDCYRRAETRDKWGTVFLDHPGISIGRFAFGVLVTSAGTGCGAGIGFADSQLFNPRARNLGAAEHSWCYSKTGKKSCGNGAFDPYSQAIKTGDVVTAMVDMDSQEISFYLNGNYLGVAFHGGIRVRSNGENRTLSPAVVLGSSDGGHETILQIVPPCVTHFHTGWSHTNVSIAPDGRSVTTEARWCTAMADHPGITSGVLRFAIRIDGEGGVAVGFADSRRFRPHAQNLGASEGTWVLSKTGKVSDGSATGFRPFTEKLAAGDIIGCEADLQEHTIRFCMLSTILLSYYSDVVYACAHFACSRFLFHLSFYLQGVTASLWESHFLM
jgi:hypothetical protein